RHTRSKRDWSSDVCSSDLWASVELSTDSSSGWREESNIRTVVDMGSTTSQDDRDRPGDESRHPGDASSPADVLTSVASALTQIEASSAARVVLAQVLSATLAAFTGTRSVRDPLPDTAPGSPEEALAVLAGIDHLRSSLSAMDAAWQVAAEQRIRHDDARRGMPASRQGAGAAGEIA